MLERIRNLREDKDLTQKQMAEKLSVAQTTYSDYELGKLNIPTSILRQLALILETSVDYLVGLTDERKPYPRAANLRQ
ncbi:MAG TPA: helix-turn-helix transcriptional regulator [Candidatus Merdivicinus intestinigallinarum]|nr:helix-turn-helix transcriptional regulator [Candidatus Merdivicinus intestinigallinarum]